MPRTTQPLSSDTPAGKLDAETVDPRFMLSLARGLLVLHAFEHAYSLNLSSAGRLTGLSRATVRRCFYTLQRLGYVSEGEDGFVVTPKLLSIGGLFRQSTDLAATARQVLKSLMEATGESCVFGTIEGVEVLAVASATPPNRVVSINLNRRIPLHCSALGRVCLAGQSTEQLEDYLRGAPFARFTDRTKFTAKELRTEIDAVRTQDHAFVDEELEPGLRSVSVPVRNASAQTIGAVAVVTVRQLSSREVRGLVRHARSSAAELGARVAPANARRVPGSPDLSQVQE
ncbi:MAG TPA: IclR family transcriptional regulator C-terminal domain-containing protein [Steroidobacteraceae bacterium]|jgi:IclR family pca regulon transcriptional regulator